MSKSTPRPPKSKAYISSDIRWSVWERDNFTCRVCGARTRLSIDHIIPESLGGPTSIANSQTLCKPCNSKKNTRLPEHVDDPELAILLEVLRADLAAKVLASPSEQPAETVIHEAFMEMYANLSRMNRELAERLGAAEYHLERAEAEVASLRQRRWWAFWRGRGA